MLGRLISILQDRSCEMSRFDGWLAYDSDKIKHWICLDDTGCSPFGELETGLFPVRKAGGIVLDFVPGATRRVYLSGIVSEAVEHGVGVRLSKKRPSEKVLFDLFSGFASSWDGTVPDDGESPLVSAWKMNRRLFRHFSECLSRETLLLSGYHPGGQLPGALRHAENSPEDKDGIAGLIVLETLFRSSLPRRASSI